VADGSSPPSPQHLAPRLVVLAGPTAVGKGTIAACVREQHPDIWISVSVTTRPPRPGEVDGLHYRFVSDEEFDRLVAEGGLLEWAVVHRTARYGTPRAPVEEQLAAGHPALLEIDLQGARQVRVTLPEAVRIFIEPPSFEALEQRLRRRAADTPEQIEQRLAAARAELAAAPEFDHRIVNDDLTRASRELSELVATMSSP
jgi:guanylate kinase